MEEKNEYVKPGVWTPWAQVICFDCHGNENLPNPKTAAEWETVTTPQPLAEGKGVTFCDDCGTAIQVDESVASEHNLVRALREQGIDAYMAQTGGMCSACGIVPSEALQGEKGPEDIGEILVTYSFDGDQTYWLGVYDNEIGPVDVEWGNTSFNTQEEVLDWVTENAEKFASLDPVQEKAEDQRKPLDDLMSEAKERAAEKNAEPSNPNKNRKPPEVGL